MRSVEDFNAPPSRGGPQVSKKTFKDLFIQFYKLWKKPKDRPKFGYLKVTRTNDIEIN